MATFTNRTDLANHIQLNILRDANAAIDGLMTVFGNQVEREISVEKTILKNRKGFNKQDAKFLTKIAKERLEGKILVPSEIAEIQRRITKYTWQIMDTKIHNGSLTKQNGKYITND